MTGNLVRWVVGSLAFFAMAGCHDPKQDLTRTGGQPYTEPIQYRARDAKEAIVDPVLVSAEDAIIAAGIKVIGVYIKGEARAYPLYILSNHQIVNDRVGGIPISASW